MGSVSAVISEPWLRWAGITHVVCNLGKYRRGRQIATEWTIAHDTRFSHISYLDWAINWESQHVYWREVFFLIADALEDPNNAVLVHCLNGKDRSCFVVYAFLRLKYEMDHVAALQCVYQRQDRNGLPLFDINRQRGDLMEWVGQNFGTATDAESGMYCWRVGTLSK